MKTFLILGLMIVLAQPALAQEKVVIKKPLVTPVVKIVSAYSDATAISYNTVPYGASTRSGGLPFVSGSDQNGKKRIEVWPQSNYYVLYEADGQTYLKTSERVSVESINAMVAVIKAATQECPVELYLKNGVLEIQPTCTGSDSLRR